jgi:photosystem II stability/assembly factor-like uncharacterized protein
LSASPLAPGRLLTGALGGEVYFSQDHGSSWLFHPNGISDARILNIAVHEERWVAGTRRGVFVSEDAGRSWQKSDFIADIGAEVNSIAFASADGLRLFLGNTNGFLKGDIFRSTDGGWVWDLIQFGDGPMRAVAVDPTDPLRVYAGYDCDLAPGGVYRSTDGGESWINETVGPVCVFALMIDPDASSNVLAGTSNGVYRSTDYGDTWSPQGPEQISVVDFSFDPDSTDHFYAATAGAGAYASDDAGLTWARLDGTSLPGYLWAIEAHDPVLGLVVGSRDGGLWRFDGIGWMPFEEADQPPVEDVRALLALPDTGRLLVGTDGAGIWEYLTNPAGVQDPATRSNDSLEILGPPSAGPFRLRGALLRPGPVSIEIFDTGGRRIRRLVQSRCEAGIGEWIWDARTETGQPADAGIYFIRMRTDHGSRTGKICKIR